MVANPARTMWTGFEGYKDPTEKDALEQLGSSFVVVDTNVLIDLYALPEPAMNLAIDALEFLQERLFVPHQVLREFWRNRQGAIAEVPAQNQPLKAVRDELLAIVNMLRPDQERTEEIKRIREQIDETLSDLETQINVARGKPLDTKKILLDNSSDPVLKRLESILEGRVGPGFGDQESSFVERGLERFAAKLPPGYMDAEEKADQLPERGTGDYLLWEQALQFVECQEPSRGFVLVTNEAKEDWRIRLKTPRQMVLGVRPELVAEALERTGHHFLLLNPKDFYRLMNKLRSVDAEESQSLSSALETVAEKRSKVQGEWSQTSYQQLLSILRRGDYDAQADVIVRAAESGGIARRAEVYEVAGYSDDRSLRRFSMPAQRAMIELIDSGELHGDEASPMEAVYEGPGKTVGYEVPDEFVRFAAMSSGQSESALAE